ncbi:MAG: tryptophan synthase subunit alpha [Ignavibacteria bacterium]|nr:tryptophan synthase subunit alpha [Ignavibacteria bacterium]
MKIREYIDSVNNSGTKVLTAFLTAGYPEKNGFVELAQEVFEAGADMLEIGIPFSDPLADGPIIQHSSQVALANGITIRNCLQYAEEIRKLTDKPLIAMGYANPILRYGVKNFINDAASAGYSGVIIPDLVVEEYNELFPDERIPLDVILLCTPTSSAERLQQIDNKSTGFVYCVSVAGTTGIGKTHDEGVLESVGFCREHVKKNKMLVGFGISTPEDVLRFAPFCDGVIVGSAIVRLLEEDKKSNYRSIKNLISGLKKSCIS